MFLGKLGCCKEPKISNSTKNNNSFENLKLSTTNLHDTHRGNVFFEINKNKNQNITHYRHFFFIETVFALFIIF